MLTSINNGNEEWIVACDHRKKFSGLRIEDESNILAFHLQYLGFFLMAVIFALMLAFPNMVTKSNMPLKKWLFKYELRCGKMLPTYYPTGVK